MPRVVIAGYGYTGSAAADLFHDTGWQVEGWTRATVPPGSTSYPVRLRDISAPSTLVDENVDVVVQVVSTRGGDAADYERVYFVGAQNLVHLFPHATLVFASSTGVYAQTDGEWVDEESMAEPSRESARVLRRTEDFALRRGGIVARLAGIYGPQRSAILEKFVRGEAIVSEKDDYVLNQVHRDDVAAALLFLAERRHDFAGEIFNIVDDTPQFSRVCYRWLADYLKRPLPSTAMQAPQRKRGATNKRVSNVKLRARGWTPRFPSFQAGMAQSVIPTWNFG